VAEEQVKKRVGIFSLTCDEGCSIYLTEIFNQKLLGWLERADLVYFLSVKNKTDFSGLDIALVEGVVTSQKDKEELEKIRSNARVLIAMGTCAMSALPSGQRNTFTPEQKEEIREHTETYGFLPRALALKEVVKVDDEIPGCPISEEIFIKTFERYLT